MNTATEDPKNQKPDFDFIMNQGGDKAAAQHAGKPDKKVIILIVLIVITVLVFIASAVFSSRQSVQQEKQASLTSEQVASYQGTVKQFLGHIKNGDNEAAYGLLEDGSVVTAEDFDEELDTTWPLVDVSDCQYQRGFEVDGDAHLLYTCAYSKGEVVVEFVFRPSDQSKIKEYVLAVSGEAQADE